MSGAIRIAASRRSMFLIAALAGTGALQQAGPHASCSAAAAAAAAAAVERSGPSIFDENWKPPADTSKSPTDSETPGPSVPAATQPSTEPRRLAPRTPAERAAPPQPITPATVPFARRLPAPSSSGVAVATKFVKDVFKEEYARRIAADQAALARKLLNEAYALADDPSLLFVLFREAKDLAVSAGEPLLAIEALRQLGCRYEMDEPALELETLTTIARTAPVARLRLTADSALALAERMVRAENYRAAGKAASVAESAARRAVDPASLPVWCASAQGAARSC